MTQLATVIGARIEPVPVPCDCADGFFHAYWRRPEFYLREDVRRGISVFAAVGPRIEDRFVHALRNDLESGQWAARNQPITTLTEAELGARLLIA